MKATVYVDAKNQECLIAENVKIVSLSEAPRYTKKGVMFRNPFAGSTQLSYDQIIILQLWSQGIRVADVIYPDGSHDTGVWINVKDIVFN